MVQGHQRGGGVRATAAETTAERQVLGDTDGRPQAAQAATGGPLQQAGGAHRQIGLRRYAGDIADSLDNAVVARREPQPVAAIHELEHGL